MKAGVWVDNRLLKQSLRQFRNQSLVWRSCTNSRIYSRITSMCKYKTSGIIAQFLKALPSFKYTDVLHGKTIGSRAFGTVKLGYIFSMQQIHAERLIYSEMSENVNFPFYMTWLIIDV